MSDFTGYNHDEEDFSAILAGAAEYSPVCGSGPGLELPHPQKWMSIENQGGRPSCVGHGATTLLEYICFLASGGKNILQLNRMFAWVESQKAGGSRPSESAGANIAAAVKVLLQIGLPLESLYPYSGAFRSSFSPEFYEDAATRKALKKYILDTTEKVFDFQKAGMGGVLWGVPWTREWHCVTTIGTLIDGKLPMANSHGKTWNKDGWDEWDERKVDGYMRTRGVVAIGVSDMETPQVRTIDWSDGGLVV